MLKDFKIEVGISLWDLQSGWDSDMYGAVEASQMAGRSSGQKTHCGRGGSMPEWKVNQLLSQIDKHKNPISAVRFWLDKYLNFFSLSFYNFKMGIIIISFS